MDLLAAVRRRAWDSRFYDLPAEAKAVPTMLTAEEGKMLCWLGEHYFQGLGAVVDLGCFLGGSSVRLASGLARSGREWRMHSYDRFQIDEFHKQKFLYKNGYPPLEGTDMFPLFEQHVAPFAGHVVPHVGEVEAHPWRSGPIEILFVDIAKTIKLNEFVLEQFFSNLIPGRSIIVQQDYLFYQTPWLIACMELLHPKIEMVSWTRDHSVLFLCNEVPSPADLKRIRYDRLPQATIERLILQARERFAFEWQREMMAIALDSYRRTPRESYGGNYKVTWSEPPSLGPWSEEKTAPATVAAGAGLLGRWVRSRRR